ncbi:MAG: hypothetical protein AAF585_00900, partial [Verrucomicrobiota bacterium]
MREAPASPLAGIPYYYRYFSKEIGWRLHGFILLCLIGVVVESLNIIAFLPLLSQGGEVVMEQGGEAVEQVQQAAGGASEGDEPAVSAEAPPSSRIEVFWRRFLAFFGLSNSFKTTLGVILVIGAIRALLFCGITFARDWLQIDLTTILRNRFTSALADCKFQHFGKQSLGKLQNCLATEIPGKVSAMTQFVAVASAMVYAIGFLSIAFVSEPLIACVAGLVGGTGMILLRFPAKFGRKVGKLRAEESGRMHQLMEQMVTHFKYLKATASSKVVTTHL